MSFKDKPLKKIVADKRVTIDAIHQEILGEFTEKKKQYHTNVQKKNELDKAQCSEEEIKELELLNKQINNYDHSEEIEYYLNTGDLLNEYYSKKEEVQINTEITVVDFMNKSKKNKKEDNLINNYMRVVDDTVIKDNFTYDLENCPHCFGRLVLKNVDSLLICEDCGYTDSIIINSEKISYKDPPRESSYFAYKRINHFNEWLAQFQAKETTDIPEEVYKGILIELKKNKFINIQELSYKNMREILKKLKYNKYY